MSKPPVFHRLRVRNFRGFRDEREFDLAASAVLVVGPNGSGKTSLFDAFQWLLLGTLDRLAPWRLRKNDEYIVNRYAEAEIAEVELTLLLSGQRVKVRRSGTQASSLLEWSGDETHHGQDAQVQLEAALATASGVDLKSAVMTSGLLQQDVTRHVLEAKPAERYEFLSRLLALESLYAFESRAKERHSTIQTELRDLEDRTMELASQESQIDARLRSIEALMTNAPGVIDAQAQVLTLAASGPIGLKVAEVSRDDAPHVLAEARLLERVLLTLQSIPPTDEATIADQDATKFAEQLRAAEQLVAQARHEHGVAAARAKELEDELSDAQQLATAALPLLADHCPVCEQAIERRAVRARLLKLRSESPELVQARAGREEAERQLNVALALQSDAGAALAAARARVDATTRLRKQRSDAEALAVTSLSKARFWFLRSAATDPSVVPQMSELLASVERLQTLLGTAARAADAERLAAELADLREQRAESEALVSSLSARARAAKLLADAATRSRTTVVDRRFAALQPLVSEVYQRLQPHPTFRHFGFHHEVFRSKGTSTPRVEDSEAGVHADPMLVFSSSQANVVALCYFLALGWAAGQKALPFMLLDDPLQSMDDINVLGFSDLCRHIRRERQVLMSAHERRFAQLLERKLAPRSEDDRTLVIEFRGWSRSGPDFEIREVTPQLREAGGVLLKVS